MIICGEEKNYLITAFGLLLWYRGMYRILDIYIPDSMTNNILLVIMALAIIYRTVGSLSIIGTSRIAEDRNKSHKPPIYEKFKQ